MDVKATARWVIVVLFALFLVGVVIQLWYVGELAFNHEVEHIADTHKDVGQILQYSGILIFVVALAGRFSARDLVIFAVFAILAFLQGSFAEGDEGSASFTNHLHVFNAVVLTLIAAIFGWIIMKRLLSGEES